MYWKKKLSQFYMNELIWYIKKLIFFKCFLFLNLCRARVLYIVLKTLMELGHEHVYSAVEKPLLVSQTAAVLEVFGGKKFRFLCALDFVCFLLIFSNCLVGIILSFFFLFDFWVLLLYCIMVWYEMLGSSWIGRWVISCLICGLNA